MKQPLLAVVNNTRVPQRTVVHVPGQGEVSVELEPAAMAWLEVG